MDGRGCSKKVFYNKIELNAKNYIRGVIVSPPTQFRIFAVKKVQDSELGTLGQKLFVPHL